MSSNKRAWKRLDSKIVFNSPWYKLRQDQVQLPNGTIMNDYFVSELPSVVIVVPITPAQEVIMVQQYRYGVQKVLLELPAGTFKPEKETPEEAIKRELLEETGYEINNLISLGTLYEYPTKDSHSIYAFLATEVKKVQEPNPEATEEIEIIKIPLGSISQKIADNEIQVSGSIAALAMARQHLNLHSEPQPPSY